MKITIDSTDQDAFIDLSGDCNPIHADELYAYRSMFGKQLVHGVHLIIKALDVFSASKRTMIFITALDVKFYNSVGLSDDLAIAITEEKDTVAIIIYNQENIIITEITFAYRLGLGTEFKCGEVNHSVHPEFHETYDDITGEEFLAFDHQKCNDLFPCASEWIASVNIAFLLASTRIIGMKCPGLHSIFYSLCLNFLSIPLKCDRVGYRMIKLHKAFRIATLELTCGKKNPIGKACAFIRPSAPRQKNIKSLSDVVTPDEFRSQQALVIGGSRGIGAQCVKLLAIGGARVAFTYHRNEKEAREIASDCKEHGYAVQYAQLDVTHSDAFAHKILDDNFHPTHLYYFATPHIVSTLSSISQEMFKNFTDIYIFALDKILSIFSNDTIQAIFYPSSTAVDELPNGMIEYSFAKYAAELYGEYLRRKKGIKVYTPRFPRVETEQTMNILMLKAISPEEILQKELRIFASMETAGNG